MGSVANELSQSFFLSSLLSLLQVDELCTENAFLQSVVLHAQRDAAENIMKARSQADDAAASFAKEIRGFEIDLASRIQRLEFDAAAASALKDDKHSEMLLSIRREAEAREADITAAARAEAGKLAQTIAHQRDAIAIAQSIASETLRAHEEELSSLRAQLEMAILLGDNRASEVREEIR